jgi:hypothetical protein
MINTADGLLTCPRRFDAWSHRTTNIPKQNNRIACPRESTKTTGGEERVHRCEIVKPIVTIS